MSIVVFLKKRVVFAWYAFSICNAFVYFLAVIAYYLPTTNWWVWGLMPLGFPFSFFAMAFITVIWMLWGQKKIGVLLLILLACGWQPIGSSFALNRTEAFLVEKKAAHLRVMQWNCQGLPGCDIQGYRNKKMRKQSTDYILKFKPDVICIQDFCDYRSLGIYSNIRLLTDTLGYSYISFAPFYCLYPPYGQIKGGSIICSKFPIVQSGSELYANRIDFPEKIQWADILINSDTIRLVSSHFRSMYLGRDFGSKDTLPISVFDTSDAEAIRSGSLLAKLKHFQKEHAGQAAQLHNLLDKTPYPVIFCGDLNSVPASNAYKVVKSNLNDAFTAKGNGLGSTFHWPAPNLRIDYILYSNNLQLHQYHHERVSFFDHDPLIAEFSVKKKQ